MALTARTIAEARASEEGREGVAAFLEKRSAVLAAVAPCSGSSSSPIAARSRAA